MDLCRIFAAKKTHITLKHVKSMRRTIIISILLYFCDINMCLGQKALQLTKRCNALRPGDFVTRSTVETENCIDNTSAVWRFDNANMTATSVRQDFWANNSNGEIVAEQQGTLQYFKEQGDSLWYHGFENSLVKVNYDIPELRLLYPMNSGCCVHGFFHGTGTYCDKFFIHTFGQYITKHEGYVMVLLPEGDTLHDVAKLHTIRLVSNVFYPMDSIKSVGHFNANCFTADSIMHYQKTDRDTLREDIYSLYVKGFRYPVIEKLSTAVKGVSESIVYYAALNNQPGIVLDEANIAIQRYGKPAVALLDPIPSSISYTAYKDKTAKVINVDYVTTYSGKLTFLLSDTLGRVIRTLGVSVEKGEQASVSISYAGMQHGHYVIYMCTETEKLAEKFSVE